MKNYVYKVNKTGTICYTLDAAVDVCYDDIRRDQYLITKRISKPIVVKVRGGYNVLVTTIGGRIFKRHIDVFVPSTKFSGCNYYLDNVSKPLDGECADDCDFVW